MYSKFKILKIRSVVLCEMTKKYEFRTLSARDRFLEWCMKAAPLFESGNGTKSIETDSNLYTDISQVDNLSSL